MNLDLSKLKTLVKPLDIPAGTTKYYKALFEKCEALYGVENDLIGQIWSEYDAIPAKASKIEISKIVSKGDRLINELERISHNIPRLQSTFEWNFSQNIIEDVISCLFNHINLLESTLYQSSYTPFAGRFSYPISDDRHRGVFNNNH